jgi:hypothetical protein
MRQGGGKTAWRKAAEFTRCARRAAVAAFRSRGNVGAARKAACPRRVDDRRCRYGSRGSAIPSTAEFGPTLGTQFLLWNFGVLGQALGAIVRAWGWGDALIAAASLVVLAAALLMLAMFYRHARGDRLFYRPGARASKASAVLADCARVYGGEGVRPNRQKSVVTPEACETAGRPVHKSRNNSAVNFAADGVPVASFLPWISTPSLPRRALAAGRCK